MDHRDAHNDVNALLPGSSTAQGPSRRTALQAVLGMGYAAAAGPLMAQTAITTPGSGLEEGWVTIPAQDFDLPAYQARPQGKKHPPVVLVVQEIFGVHAYIQDVCRRLARAGYMAIAPELYARQGKASDYTEIAQLQTELVSKVPDAQVLGDLDATLAWAAKAGGNVQKAAITGFCWGGRITWLYAASGKVRAGVAWYGRLEGQSTPLTPVHPLALAGQLKAPVLGLYGGQDSGIPVASVARMQAALAQGSAAAKASELVLYPDAPHAFHADYRASYREAAAQDGWQRLLQWLRRNGV